MKSGNSILQAITLAAIIVLYILYFTGTDLKRPSAQTTSAGPKQTDTQAVSVAYINFDSILKSYTYYQELKSSLESQQQIAEKQLESKVRALENEYKSLSTKVTLGLMKEEEAQRILAIKQQDVEKYRTDVSENLYNEEKKLTLQLYDTIVNYLKRHNKKTGYSYILSYTKGGGIIIAPDQHDLTIDVLAGLNEEYRKTSKKAK